MTRNVSAILFGVKVDMEDFDGESGVGHSGLIDSDFP